MAKVTGNLPPSQDINSTTEYFNNYFTDRFTGAPTHDAVIGYFQKVTGSLESGKLLAATIIYTAQTQGIDPMELVDEFKKLPAGKKTKVRNPVDSSRVTTSYTTYDQIVENVDSHSVGQLFYIESLNTFYESYRDLNQELLVRSASNYEVDKIAVNDGFDYNFYIISYTEDKDELTPYLTVLLNQNRVSTSLLGISNVPSANKYVTRTVLA